MHRLFRISALTMLVAMMSSCVTTGHNFPSNLAWIKKETTTMDDVRLVLGSPFAVGNSSGVVTWTYAYFKYDLFGKSSHKELKFYWNSDRSIKHFSFNSSFPSDLTGSVKNRASRKKYVNGLKNRPINAENNARQDEFERF